VNLIQIGSKEKIYIFDLYTLENNVTTLKLAVDVIRLLHEDPKIEKVFFDCRKDCEALHFILGICPKNIIDIQAVHLLLEHMKIFVADELRYELYNVTTPGLNDVLGCYETTHGVNDLKEKMKYMFKKKPKDLFFVRPLSKDFVSYSAQDVEDLPQVREIIQDKLFDLLGEMNRYLMDCVSLSYSSYSCKKYTEKQKEKEEEKKKEGEESSSDKKNSPKN
jgi:ribonuclease D